MTFLSIIDTAMNINLVIIFPFIFLFSSCGLLNSGSVNVKYTSFKVEYQDVTYENEKNLSNLSISVRNLEHASKVGKWNFTTKVSPSFHYEQHTIGTLENRVINGVTEQYPDLKLKRLAAFANLKFTFHTPFGAFQATAGFGGATQNIVGDGKDKYSTTEIRKVDFVYYKFLTRRIFILFGPRYYRDQYEQVTVAFRLGWFWGRT